MGMAWRNISVDGETVHWLVRRPIYTTIQRTCLLTERRGKDRRYYRAGVFISSAAYSPVINTHTRSYTTINKWLAQGEVVQQLPEDDTTVCGLLARCQDPGGQLSQCLPSQRNISIWVLKFKVRGLEVDVMTSNLPWARRGLTVQTLTVHLYLERMRVDKRITQEDSPFLWFWCGTIVRHR